MIHCFEIGERNLVLDVNSGALHSVDDAAFYVLKNMAAVESVEKCRELRRVRRKPAARFSRTSECERTIFQHSEIPADTPESLRREIRELIDAGQLFSRDRADEAHEHMQNRNPVVKALCLHIAHECNLRCKYCFAGQGNYSENDRGLMPFEVGKNAIDFLIENSGTRRNLEVDFFGGEPMLNFDVVKKIVAYGREREGEKNFRFTLTTNAALLSDENISYINETFDNVVLSLDGRKHVNDNMRPFAGGGGSYDEILPRIKALADARQGANYYVRGTYTRHNLDFAADVLHLADAGFKNISVEPVVAPADTDYAIREEDLPALFAEYEKLALALLAREREGRGIFFFHFETDLSGGPCIAKRVTGCGAGAEYLAVTPSGRLYPCHQFVGDEKFMLDAPSPAFSANHVFTKPECAACWAKFHCGGGCFATAYHMNGDISKPDKISCELMKKRVECALFMFAERQ
ncbi:MAG: thioether cross-link-forming SCIFF peptide maturase [Defluviitaleaceae bacterium]|nr:thioether cross-link-forming SCIFF peptide maturase [Defluviitaleaceae bacterium]